MCTTYWVLRVLTLAIYNAAQLLKTTSIHRWSLRTTRCGLWRTRSRYPSQLPVGIWWATCENFLDYFHYSLLVCLPSEALNVSFGRKFVILMFNDICCFLSYLWMWNDILSILSLFALASSWTSALYIEGSDLYIQTPTQIGWLGYKIGRGLNCLTSN